MYYKQLNGFLIELSIDTASKQNTKYPVRLHRTAVAHSLIAVPHGRKVNSIHHVIQAIIRAISIVLISSWQLQTNKLLLFLITLKLDLSHQIRLLDSMG